MVRRSIKMVSGIIPRPLVFALLAAAACVCVLPAGVYGLVSLPAVWPQPVRMSAGTESVSLNAVAFACGNAHGCDEVVQFHMQRYTQIATFAGTPTPSARTNTYAHAHTRACVASFCR